MYFKSVYVSGSVGAHGNDRASAGGYGYAWYKGVVVRQVHAYVSRPDDRDDRALAIGFAADSWRQANFHHDASDRGRYHNSSCSWWPAHPR